ncbi:hypothetical protein LIER_31292 [Lithospermum erythrorhizon]|uniref:Uncharacterized protein n=1 Tax=Lithospermum erythrorhizon TaxID=34254 RepID=A0AAV3RWF7_LITER
MSGEHVGVDWISRIGTTCLEFDGDEMEGVFREIILISAIKRIEEVYGGVFVDVSVWKCSITRVAKGSIKVCVDVLILVLVVIVNLIKVVEESTFSVMATVKDGMTNSSSVLM